LSVLKDSQQKQPTIQTSIANYSSNRMSTPHNNHSWRIRNHTLGWMHNEKWQFKLCFGFFSWSPEQKGGQCGSAWPSSTLF